MTSLARLALIAVTVGAAACTSTPSAPLPPYMSPYPAGKYAYGYSEERLGPDTWRIIYRGPLQELPVDQAARAAALERAAAATHELALLRAAQLARAESKPAFAIVDRRTDTDTQRQPGSAAYDPFWPGASPALYRDGRYPYWHAPLWAPPVYVPGHAAGKATTTLVIRLERRVTASNVNAAETEARLEQAWRGRAPSR